MSEKLLDEIYRSLTGFYIPEAAVPGVPNLFAPHSRCDREYARMRDAYERVCIRLGVDADEEDEDLNVMVEAMEAIQQELAGQMFLLGMEYASRY